MKFVFDMETGDPDDFITLLLLLGHPQVDLVGVTVTPGGPDQIGLVRWALDKFGVDIPVGSFHDPQKLERSDFAETGKKVGRVSQWHYNAIAGLRNSYEAENGADVLERLLGEDTTLVTGAPLKNLGALLQRQGEKALGRLYVQGGFAGEGVVPPEKQLEKFRGRRTCPTYNLGGDPNSALLLLNRRKRFSDLRFVSKNVCHGVVYNQELHAEFVADAGCKSHSPEDICRCLCHIPGQHVMHVMECCNPCPHCGVGLVRMSPGLNPDRHLRSIRGVRALMEDYLDKKPGGKAFHDPLAAACAINPEIGEWAEVELFKEKGEWGSILSPGSGVKIITGYNPDLFVKTLLGRS